MSIKIITSFWESQLYRMVTQFLMNYSMVQGVKVNVGLDYSNWMKKILLILFL